MINVIQLFDDNDFYKRLSNVVLKMDFSLNLQQVNPQLFFTNNTVSIRNSIIVFNQLISETYRDQLFQLSVVNSMVFVNYTDEESIDELSIKIADQVLNSKFKNQVCSAILKIASQAIEIAGKPENLTHKLTGNLNAGFEWLLNNISEGVFCKDRNQKYFAGNRQFCADFGIRNPNDIIGKSDIDLLNEKEVKDFIAYDQQVLQAGVSFNDIEKEITIISGKCWLQIQKFPIKDSAGNVFGILGVYKKRSEQKGFENYIKEQETFLEKLFEVIPDSIYFKDEQSQFLKINNAHAKLLKIENVQDAIGKTDFDFLSNDFARHSFAEEQRVIFEKNEISNITEQIKVGDKTKWFQSSKIPVTDEYDQVVGIIGVGREITHEIKLKSKLNNSNTLISELVNSSESAVLLKDKSFTIIEANQSAVVLFKANTIDQLLTEKETHFVDEKMSESIAIEDNGVLESGVPLLNKVTDLTLLNGEVKRVQVSRIPVKDENGQVFSIIVKYQF